MSQEYIFIADYFLGDFFGGAEMANEELLTLLSQEGNTVIRKYSADVTKEYILENKGSRFIVSNFMLLGGGPKEALYRCNYVLYEHDHKYVVNRNPASYPDFTAPRHLIINQEFYENSLAVFCQSKIHAEVLKKNIPLANTINLGTSLWTTEFLSDIKNIVIPEKNGRAAIMKSDNVIKNQQMSEKYCNDNNIPYDLLEAPSSLDFYKLLTKYTYFVFFPKVLETLSRVTVEAKLAGCEIITNKMLGVISEDWFSGNPTQIMEVLEDARKSTPKKFTDAFLGQKEIKESNFSDNNITVILNSYRRPHNLKAQIEAIRSQTIQPKEIWLWINKHEDNQDFDHHQLDVDRVFSNDYNWKFYGRFAAALLADTEYVAIFDDDTIPGSKWFENCLDSMDQEEGIQGSAGIILKSEDYYMKHARCGWPTQNEDRTRVDLVGHAWFFKRDWLQFLWREKPFTWDNGEDIQFSYLAQKYGGINTFCPPHPSNDKELHGSTRGNELGIDSKATSNNQEVSHQQFFQERDMCIQNAIKNGWKTVEGLSK
tara:strand:+ start:15206 stop:16825 length:1620 start_codon:yes stop_codon:yes gene_type:complete